MLVLPKLFRWSLFGDAKWDNLTVVTILKSHLLEGLPMPNGILSKELGPVSSPFIAFIASLRSQSNQAGTSKPPSKLSSRPIKLAFATMNLNGPVNHNWICIFVNIYECQNCWLKNMIDIQLLSLPYWFGEYSGTLKRNWPFFSFVFKWSRPLWTICSILSHIHPSSSSQCQIHSWGSL